MTKEEQKAVEEFTEMNLTKKGLYHYNDMQDAFLIGLFKGEKMRPSLPSNLDEAAEEIMPISYGALEVDIYGGSEPVYSREQMVEMFKAGAELMAGKFQQIEGELVDWYETNGVDYCHGISTNGSFEVPEGFYIKKK